MLAAIKPLTAVALQPLDMAGWHWNKVGGKPLPPALDMTYGMFATPAWVVCSYRLCMIEVNEIKTVGNLCLNHHKTLLRQLPFRIVLPRSSLQLLAEPHV